MRTMCDRLVRGGALCLALFACSGFLPGPARAAFSGSRHDFSSTGPYNYPALIPAGKCSACHRPHKASNATNSPIWSHDLSQEQTFFDLTADPAYVPEHTLMCYDCHDDANTSPSPRVDNDPPNTTWSSGHVPQNIAFTDAVPLNYTTTPTVPGYYELADGRVPITGPTDGSPTGGHYWKQEPDGPIKQGDKIACDLCHDPHDTATGTNDVMFRTSTPSYAGGISLTKIEQEHRASHNVHDPTVPGTGRSMCAECHGYALPSTYAPVIIYGKTLPRPGTGKPQHRESNTTPCTDCHKHNKITASCTECHGYPPLLTYAQGGNNYFDKTLHPTVENYDGGAGAHQRHLDALGTAIFDCQICHGPNPGSASWHNFGAGTVSAANVDIMGQAASWDPDGTRSTGYSGATSSETLPSGYEFVAKGGGNRQCFGLACHGGPPATPVVLTWTADMVDGDTPYDNPVAGDVRICKWCHDGTPALIDFGSGLRVARNVLGNNDGAGGVWNTGTWGAEVNGHGLASGSQYDVASVGGGGGRSGAAKDCTLCHDATYSGSAPVKTHFDGAYMSAEKRLKPVINGQPVANADAACTACHQNTGADQGTQVSHHGNSSAGGYQPLEGAFTRLCRQCHDVHGANWNGTGRNLNMVGKWLETSPDGVGDVGEHAHVDTDGLGGVTTTDGYAVFTARTGTNSFDADDGTPADNICYTCHTPVSTPPTGTGGGQHNGTTGMTDVRGQDCMQCHDHDFDDQVASADGFMPSGCTGCHGEGGNVHPGTNNGAGDDAPNVMTVNVAGTWYSVWNGEYWDTQMGGTNTVQQGGHGGPDGKPAIECTACHNTGYPNSPATHLNGVHESTGDTKAPSGANSNTAHLKPELFTKYAPAGGPYSWSTQVGFDNYCYQECHAVGSNSVSNHRHERDTQPTDSNYRSVELGTHITGTVPVAIPPRTWRLAMDSDLNSVDTSGGPNYAPCISCHNPHGATTNDIKNNSNKMVRDLFKGGTSPLCVACHL